MDDLTLRNLGRLPTHAELDAYNAHVEENRAYAARYEYRRAFAYAHYIAQPHMDNDVASLRRFPRHMYTVDDSMDYVLPAGQKEPPLDSVFSERILAYTWVGTEPVAVAFRDGYKFEARVDRDTHNLPNPRETENWLEHWTLLPDAKELVPGLPDLNDPSMPRLVRWETDSERWDRCLWDYREEVYACPLWQRDWDGQRARTCGLGNPCASCAKHPGAPWYQPGEKWANQPDAHDPSPPSSPSGTSWPRLPTPFEQPVNIHSPLDTLQRVLRGADAWRFAQTGRPRVFTGPYPDVRRPGWGP